MVVHHNMPRAKPFATWCLLKQTPLQLGASVAFTCCKEQTSQQEPKILYSSCREQSSQQLQLVSLTELTSKYLT
jgi:hypothetical protein